MAWAHVQNGIKTSYDSGNSFTASFGSAPTSGNVLLVMCGLQNATGAIGWTPASGYTLLAELEDSDIDGVCALFGKIAGASESSSPTFTWSGNDSFTRKILWVEYSGNHASTVEDVASLLANEGFVSSFDSTGLTTSTDGALHVLGYFSFAATTTPPSGYTERRDSGGCWFADKTISPAGSTGAFTITKSADSTVSFELALKPAAAAGTTPKGWFGQALYGPLRRAVT